ncbi:hypothetical protein H696_02872 [Fonticula alba]|uniref:Uncharacterized protein n=1 Tax=Fonticula alba TaxID=691883 RepID=A0A058Z8G1_FONAL|nr:hypothetical protein H696_02872 [Fonticula alba]KCV70525.1 hypothetical protein H696_02872 [Fonticula alba]|eukprot:XP_009495041.1 hypothetical protein H696_02872 [Fonticula alba]
MLATDLADHDDAEFEDELNNLMAGESHQLPTDTQTDLPATSIEELPVLPPVPTHDPRTTLPAIDDTASSSDEKDDQTEADSARPAKTPSASKRQQVAA